jgi:hypothetical protein
MFLTTCSFAGPIGRIWELMKKWPDLKAHLLTESLELFRDMLSKIKIPGGCLGFFHSLRFCPWS